MRIARLNHLALTVTLLISVGSLFAAPPAAQSTDVAAKAINALGIGLMRMASVPDANVLLSPFSIQSALAMTYAGADGATREEMAKVLHYPTNDVELHTSFGALRLALGEVMRKSTDAAAQSAKYGARNDPITLVVANRLYGQSGYEFRAPFLTLLKSTYGAPFEVLDFVNDSSAATTHINNWVENQTRQHIRDLIPSGALNNLTRLVLVDALYLKAPWANPFQPGGTKPGKFLLMGGEAVEVPMMAQFAEFRYCKGNGFSVLELPYRGNDLRFLLFLPDETNGLAALEAKLTSDVLTGEIKWEECDVTLYLPKFKLEPPMLPLGSILQTLGMKSAFDKPIGSANFNRIAPRRPNDYLYISDVFHKTFLKLDEEGTEAAAATAIELPSAGGGGHEPKKRVEVRVDHPFFFAIQHRASRACLFLGHVTDPR